MLQCHVPFHYNGAQRYQQFSQVGRLNRALIGLALCLLSASVFSVFMLLFFVTFFTLPFSELSLVGLALDLVD